MEARGFTIVEVLVALLVLSVGMLGSVSIFTSVARTFNSGHAAVESAANAAEVLESVRGGGCGGANAGSGIGAHGAYTWNVEEITSELRLVTVILSSVGVRARTDTFSATIAC